MNGKNSHGSVANDTTSLEKERDTAERLLRYKFALISLYEAVMEPQLECMAYIE